MIKWEYYRKFKERFQTVFILKNLEFKRAYAIYWVLKIIQAIVIYGVANGFREKKYFDVVMVILILINWMLEVRESKARLYTTMKKSYMKEFYLTNSKYSKVSFIRGMAASEVLWNMGEGIGISFPLIFALVIKKTRNLGTSMIVTCLAIIILYSIEFLMLLFEHKKVRYLELIVKTIWIGVFVGLGNYVSAWVLSCPLNKKTNVMEAMKEWINGIHSLKFAIDMNTIFRMGVLLFLLTLYVIWLRKQKDKNSIYGSLELKVRDLGLFPIIFISFFSGILMKQGGGKEEIVYLINMLIISYTISFLLDDIFYFHDELSIDSEEEKIYYWKTNLKKLLEYKEGIYTHFYVKRIIVFYAIFYVGTIYDITDVYRMLFGIATVLLMCAIGFYEKNLAVINSPVRITKDYGTTKYDRNRTIENNVIGGKLLLIGIVLSIPAILYACNEVARNVFYVLQMFEILGLVLYVLMAKRNLEIKMEEKHWMIQLFDEDDGI